MTWTSWQERRNGYFRVCDEKELEQNLDIEEVAEELDCQDEEKDMLSILL